MYNAQARRLVALDGEYELASVSIENREGNLYVQDPVIEEIAGALALARELQRLAGKANMFFPVGDEPQHQKLRKILTRMGATKYIELWRINESGN
jgi:esterase/lipase superfamily enzyme